MVKDANKPKGKMTSYAFFVQTCREEHKKKHPGESVVFADFSRKCAEKWKGMEVPDKKRFEEMAQKDKKRYEAAMKNYNPPPSDVKGGGKRKAKKTKDPNAPKRAMSAFFFFSGEERGKVKAANPGFTIGDIAKTLGKQWEKVTDKSRYETSAQKDRARYEKEMAVFRGTKAPASPNKKPKMSGKAAAAAAAAAAAQAQAERSEEDDEEEEDEEEEEEDEEEEEEDDEEDDE